MKYDWPGRFFQGRLILWYFQFPAGINQSRVADQFPVQGDDLGHGAAVLSGDFPEGVALSDDVYPTFLILRQNSIGSAACDRRSALGNLKLPAGVNPVRVLDPITVGCHDLGYGAVVFSGDCPESVPRLYGIGQIRGGVFHDRRGNFTVGLFSGAAVVSLILLYDIAGVVAGNDGSRVLRPFCIECFISRFGSRDLCNGRAGKLLSAYQPSKRYPSRVISLAVGRTAPVP